MEDSRRCIKPRPFQGDKTRELGSKNAQVSQRVTHSIECAVLQRRRLQLPPQKSAFLVSLPTLAHRLTAHRFMIAGPLHDDGYRMVEDEFLNVAHQFTTHLHRAEYNRLKALAKTKNAAAIREIQRPVVGPQTLLAKRRLDSVRREAKQRKLLDPGADDDQASDLPWMGTSLQGLMESPRKEMKWISSAAAATATTRASAGFRPSLESPPRQRLVQQQRSSTTKRRLPTKGDASETSDEDDLATPSKPITMKTSRITQPSSAVSARSSTRPLGNPVTPRTVPKPDRKSTSDRHRQAATLTELQTPHNRPSSKGDDDDADNDDDPFGLNRRRARRQQSKEQTHKPEQTEGSKKLSADTIPSFL
ncbi:hypothetical protein G7046_g1651 [Stylonectria norvegica]|nr:hypothetical protein G7046_g1651 [Stylonectria norvegica]